MTLGYKEIYMPNHPKARKNGCILEQRFIAERIIGRFLDDKEVIHHKDGDRNNNSEYNLMIFKTQSDHARYHSGFYSELILKDGVYICKQKTDICPICKKIFNVKFDGQKYCSYKCSHFNQRKVSERPSKNKILELLKTNSYCAIGRLYGVSDNAVRKWLK